MHRGTHAQTSSATAASVRSHLTAARLHLMRDGVLVTMLYVLRLIDGTLHRLGIRRPPRDAGEPAAERFLRALGYRTLARNWRSPRDPRDEADLLMLTSDAATLVIVEVKRARGPWDALDRVDGRKRAALWRLLGDLTGGDASVHEITNQTHVQRVRVDLIGVRGEGRHATAVRHVVGLFERPARPNTKTSGRYRQ